MGVISWYKKASAPPRSDLSYTNDEIQSKFAEFYTTDYEVSKSDRFLAQFWDSFDKAPAYKRYLHKLDACVMSYFFLSFFIKTLDNTNVSNAYVSGMQEALNLNGQQRNLFNTFQYLGVIVGSVPGQAIMHNNIRPAIWVPLCEVLWSIVVIAMAAVQNAKTIYALKFIIGLLEASNYPAIAQILGAWYRPEEIAKRMSVYDISAAVGSMCSGFIQSGVYATLNGAAGLAGWRWLFVIDGIISLPIAVLGFYCLPDYPYNTRAVWLTEKEKEFSVIRSMEMGKKQKKHMTVKKFLSFFKSWRIYGFSWPYILFNIATTYSYFNLWLKALDMYSVEQINLIPCAGYGGAIVITYIFANFSDRVKKRAPFILASVFLTFLGNMLLQIWEIPFALKYIAQFLLELGYPVWALILTWSAESFQDDPELCGILTAFGNTISNAISAWLPLVAFPTQDAPRYKWGYGFMAGLNVLSAIGVFFFVYMERRENRKLGRVLNKYGLAVDVADIKDYETNGPTILHSDSAEEISEKKPPMVTSRTIELDDVDLDKIEK
ncbi:major facilitator superfamily domain-containing protein [Dipodascopsis tothii]|uniref:major facilitator superfamily domain-containing protein n=1 Tax=Dipodascopsis tothii TaxID=44089 RepID=UPI0034CEB2E3